jgi:hypothetical protein
MISVPACADLAELEPLIITSPALRSGTTLLQRLLCSADNALVYGETCALDLEFFAKVYASKALMYQANRARFRQTRAQVAAGETNAWILDLMPDLDGYLQALGRACAAGLAYCRDEAVRSGRPLWGVKCPAWPPEVLQLLRTLLPRSRWLYIHRDVLDCLRSARAQQMVRSEQDVAALCRGWVASLTYVLGLGPDPQFLLLRYEELVAQPAANLERIATFSGARGIDPRVLDHRINTWSGEEALYVPPVALTDNERRIAEELTGELRRRLTGGAGAVHP